VLSLTIKSILVDLQRRKLLDFNDKNVDMIEYPAPGTLKPSDTLASFSAFRTKNDPPVFDVKGGSEMISIPKSKRKTRLPSYIYAYADCFIMFSSVYIICGNTPLFTDFIREIARLIFYFFEFCTTCFRFFISLWTVGNRGKINELLLHFLILFSPNCTIHTPTKRLELVNLLLEFWKVLTDSEHWIPLSYLSGKTKTILSKTKFYLILFIVIFFYQ
jgi:hypothetical protein